MYVDPLDLQIAYRIFCPPAYVNMIASISFKAVLIHHLNPAQQLLPEKFHYSPWGVLKQVQQVVNDFGQRRDAL